MLQGLVGEFFVPKYEDPRLEVYQFQWLYINGLLAVIFSFGLLYTAIKSRRARSWKYGFSMCKQIICWLYRCKLDIIKRVSGQ